jgi:hypothetical protein
MAEKLQRIFNITITCLLVFQLTGCGTLLYPERRGQIAGRLDAGIVILDTVGLLFFIIPGAIAFAVDFSNGCIYLPARPVIIQHSAELREIKFDPKHTSLAQIEKIIKDQTGYAVHLTQGNVRISRLKSKEDMMMHFAQVMPDIQNNRLAFNF